MAKRKYHQKKTKKKSISVLGKLFRFILLLLILATVLAYLSFKGWNSKLNNSQNTELSVVNTSMGSIEYISKGEGPIILLSHMEGSGSDNLKMFDEFTKAGYKIISPSRPGYFGTPLNNDANYAYQADLFAELLDHLNINQKIIVLGLSAGGPAAIEFAKKYTDKCASLILINSPSSKLKSETALKSLMNIHSIPYINKSSDLNSWFTFNLAKISVKQIVKPILNKCMNATEQERNTQIDQLVSRSKTKEELLNYLKVISPKRNRISGFKNDLKNLSDYQIGSKKIRIPVLIIHSKKNQIINFNHAEQTKRIFPKAQLYSYDGLGHAFWMGNDRSMIHSKILDFIKTDKKQKDGSANRSNVELVGITWVNKTDGALLQLKSDGTFTLDFPSVDTKKFYQGTYTIVDSQISFTYNEDVNSCLDISGVYNFKIIRKALDLKVINDKCNARKKHFSEGWFKV